MCSRRLKQVPFGRTYGPKIRCIDPLDGCACMITSRMLNALRYLSHLCLHQSRRRRSGRTASAGPLFWTNLLSVVSLFSRFGSFFFVLTLDWPQSLMSIFSKTDNLSKIAIDKLYLEVEVLGLDIRDW